MPGDKHPVRLAAVGDLHCGKNSQGTLQPLFARMAEQADVMVLAGDLTAYGLAEEARVLARELTAAAKIPIVGVLGNHEYESGKDGDVRQIITDAGVTLLDGDSVEIHGVGFGGVKGFGGGFGRYALTPWGEPTMKQFVREALDEVLKLESALARLRTPRRVAVLHYAPIMATVEGEPLEIYPFLGSSRLEEPLNRLPVTVVLHGHAHNGQPEGRTQGNKLVYNVAMPLLARRFPNQPPFRLIELEPVSDAAIAPAPSASSEGMPPNAT